MPQADMLNGQMARSSATNAADAATVAALKDISTTMTREVATTNRKSEDTESSALPSVDLSTLEGGPTFTTKSTAASTTTTPALPLQSKPGNIPRVHATTPTQQPFTFGQTPQPTGIRYPPGFNPSSLVSRPQRPVRASQNAQSPPFVPAAPPSALSSPATSPPITSPSLPIPNSREFTFNVKPSANTLSPHNTLVAPSFPDTTIGDKKMFLATNHRKRNMIMTPAVSEYEADLTSKDRMKQKEAVKKILAAKVRSDWAENWVDTVPDVGEVLKPAEEEVKVEGDGETEEKWVERSEWLSELSSSESEEEAVTPKPLSRVPTQNSERPSFLRRLSSGKTHTDPFRFENPDSVGEVLKRKVERKKVRRQKRFVDELRENEGLRCFTTRRNVWTGAKIVKRPLTKPVSKSSANGGAVEGEAAPAPAPEVMDGKEIEVEQMRNDTSISLEAGDEWDDVIIDTLIPIPPPLLPPSTPMRKNVTSRNYTTIYDKIILGGQTPLCPINLQTVVNSCVEGWKRDGEWPPRSTVENDALMSRKKVVGEAKKNTAAGSGTWRRSLQRVFGKGDGTAGGVV